MIVKAISYAVGYSLSGLARIFLTKSEQEKLLERVKRFRMKLEQQLKEMD